MNTKNILFVLCFFMSAPIIAIFEQSPWFLIENNSNFDLHISMVIQTPPIQADQMNIICPEYIEELEITITAYEEDQEYKSLLMQLDFMCKSQDKILLPSIFHVDDIYFNPTIRSCDFIIDTLQLQHSIELTDAACRHFEISYDDTTGFIGTARPISMHIKILHNAKESLRYLLSSALHSLDSFPY